MARWMFLIVFSGVLIAQTAGAHEKRSVEGYDLVVGFLNEPAFSGQVNALDLRVSRDGKPVEGLEKTLKASVAYGDRSRQLALKKRYSKPGEYAGYFIPSATGHYAFRVQGDLSGAAIDETFDSRDGRFSQVADSEELRFP